MKVSKLHIKCLLLNLRGYLIGSLTTLMILSSPSAHADLLLSSETYLTVSDLSILFPLDVIKSLPNPQSFLTEKQMEEVRLTIPERVQACIVGIRIDPNSPLRAEFQTAHASFEGTDKFELTNHAKRIQEETRHLTNIKEHLEKNIKDLAEENEEKLLNDPEKERFKQLEEELAEVTKRLSMTPEFHVVRKVNNIPSFRLIIQDCNDHGDLGVHVLYKFDKEEINNFLVLSVLLREKESVFIESDALIPRWDLVEDKDSRTSYIQKFSRLLDGMIQQSRRIHRIASMKSTRFTEWAFRAVDVSFEMGEEIHTTARIANIPYVEEIGDSFQQTLMHSFTNRFEDLVTQSIFLTEDYITAVVPRFMARGEIFLGDERRVSRDPSLRIKSGIRPMIAFPMPIQEAKRNDIARLVADSPLKVGLEDVGANPSKVNPGNTDCLSCHILPSLSAQKDTRHRDIFNTGHFRWFRNKPTISNLVVNETNRIYEEIRPTINSRLREIRELKH